MARRAYPRSDNSSERPRCRYRSYELGNHIEQDRNGEGRTGKTRCSTGRRIASGYCYYRSDHGRSSRLYEFMEKQRRI